MNGKNSKVYKNFADLCRYTGVAEEEIGKVVIVCVGGKFKQFHDLKKGDLFNVLSVNGWEESKYDKIGTWRATEDVDTNALAQIAVDEVPGTDYEAVALALTNFLWNSDIRPFKHAFGEEPVCSRCGIWGPDGGDKEPCKPKEK